MKVIAVFDIENDRIFDYSCDLHVWNEFGDVRLAEKDVLLRPLPHSKQMENRWFSDDYSKGWNDCLAEITGETE